MDWKQGLRDVCLEIPFETKLTEVSKLCREYLRERTGQCICRECKQSFLTHNTRQIVRFPTCPECLTAKTQKQELREKNLLEQQKQIEESRRSLKVHNYKMGLGNPASNFQILLESFTPADKERLSKIPYQEFLNTHYWRVVSAYVKYRQHKCQLCGSIKQLNVHHKDYTQRGNEIERWQESLITLCHSCHARFHNRAVA
jgi:5-methylcytosine-specific restriction endonuclease McrA